MQITTPRLILREVSENDFEALCVMDQDPEAGQYDHPPLSVEASRSRINTFLAWQQESPRTRFSFALVIPPGEGLMGLIGFRQIHPAIREYEMGWAVRREEWGKGYASEAARAVLRWGFEHLLAHRVVAFCNAENRASERVMQKLGMQREGLTRETLLIDRVWHDELIYAILDREVSRL